MHMTLVVPVLPVRVPVRARALSYSLSPPPPRLCTNILLQLLQLVHLSGSASDSVTQCPPVQLDSLLTGKNGHTKTQLELEVSAGTNFAP